MGRIPWAAPTAVGVVIPWRILGREHKTNIGRCNRESMEITCCIASNEMWAKGLSCTRADGREIFGDAPRQAVGSGRGE